MRILLFSGDAALLGRLRKELKILLMRNRQEAQVFSFSLLKEALAELGENRALYDLLILDLDHISDPIQIYKEFRTSNFLCAIILLCESYGKMPASMPLRPSAYLKKPFEAKHLTGYIQLVLNEYKSTGRFFELKRRKSLERIAYREIECFESNQRIVTLYTTCGTTHMFTARLDDVEKSTTAESFVRCHQSYLINLDHVKKLDRANRQFQMASGKTVDISRRSMPAVTAAFEAYLTGKGKPIIEV